MKTTLLILSVLFSVVISREGGVNARMHAKRTLPGSDAMNRTTLPLIIEDEVENTESDETFSRNAWSSGQDDGVAYRLNDEAIDILTSEGSPGWIDKVINKSKAIEQKMKEKQKGGNMSDAQAPVDRSSIDAGPPQGAMASLKRSLSSMGSIGGPASTGMSQLTNNWQSKPFAEKAFATTALMTAARNIDLFANARENPMGAVVGAVNIVASFAAVLGPTGMVISVGFSFLSGIFSLFGKKGEKPKSVGQVVAEQINSALDNFYDESLSDEAHGAIEALRHSKAFLDGVASSGEMISESEAVSLGSHVPVYYGVKFMAKLAAVIQRLVSNNKPKDAKRCIKYVELYCTLATMKNLILQQFASLLPESHKNIRAGIYQHLRSLQYSQEELLGFLYKSDPENKIMPYFDPESSPVTDRYMLEVIKIKNYNRWLAGTYCLTPGTGKISLVWTTSDKRISEDRPYVKLDGGNNCYWKVVPHGNYLFSIVNTKRCPHDEYCGALLSFDDIGDGKARVTIDQEDPVLWKIVGTDQKRIQNYKGCTTTPKSKHCLKELGVGVETYRKYLLFKKTVATGQLVETYGGYVWWLTKEPR